MKYTPIIGLEIHVELNTQSKMFCGCDAHHFNVAPNTHTCPTCLGLPGALPVVNQVACEYCLKIGLALNCTVLPQAIFARKHYAYPDLAKGYQLSQYELPFCVDGTIEVANRAIRIKRVHMEEDTGKLQHGELNGKNVSFIDFNRGGVPLVEIVTEHDFHSVTEIEEYARKVQRLMRYLGVSSADMDKGSMRFEANISLSPDPNTLPNYKVEVKNLNSFKALTGATEYEITSQAKILESGILPPQQTKGWDDAKEKTYTQREKEDAHDYRYFPDPDISPMSWMKSTESKLEAEIPELPWQKKTRYIRELGLSEYDATLLTEDKITAEYFESGLRKSDVPSQAKKLANWMNGELNRLRNLYPTPIQDLKFTAQNIVQLIELLDEGKVSQTNAKVIFEQMYNTGASPQQIIDEKGLAQITDSSIVENAVKKVITEQVKAVEDYKKGKETVIQFLVGMAMKELKGKGNVDEIKNLLKEQLSKL